MKIPDNCLKNFLPTENDDEFSARLKQYYINNSNATKDLEARELDAYYRKYGKQIKELEKEQKGQATEHKNAYKQISEINKRVDKLEKLQKK